MTDNLGLRTRISVLWIFFAVAMAAHYALYAFEPGALEDVMSGEMALQPELAMAETLMNWLIPLTMAFITVTLSDQVARRLNVILAGVYILLGFFHLATCPIVHLLEGPSAHQFLVSLATIGATVLIFRYAWRWQ